MMQIKMKGSQHNNAPKINWLAKTGLPSGKVVKLLEQPRQDKTRTNKT